MIVSSFKVDEFEGDQWLDII